MWCLMLLIENKGMNRWKLYMVDIYWELKSVNKERNGLESAEKISKKQSMDGCYVCWYHGS
jgi:hypothetical protein